MGKLLMFLVVLVAAGFVIESLSKPVYHLRTVMPPEFAEAPSSSPPQKRASEENIARAYWACAVDTIQWRYGYNYRLPQDPPSDFIVSSPQFGDDADDPATRARYWHALQRMWYVPDNWTKTYQWDTGWATSWLDTVHRIHAN